MPSLTLPGVRFLFPRFFLPSSGIHLPQFDKNLSQQEEL